MHLSLSDGCSERDPTTAIHALRGAVADGPAGLGFPENYERAARAGLRDHRLMGKAKRSQSAEKTEI